MINIKLRTIALISTILMIIIIGVAAILTSQKTISNTGRVKAIGVELYTDSTKTTALTNIDWNMIEPNETKYHGCYAYNNGDTPITLTFSTGNWTPTEASSYITLDWDYTNIPIESYEGLELTFSLFVSPNIHMSPNATITDFSFDTLVTAQG